MSVLGAMWMMLAAGPSGGGEGPPPDAPRRVERFAGGESGSLPAGWRALSGAWGVRDGELACDAVGESDARVFLPRGPWSDFRLHCVFRVLEVAGSPSSLSAVFSAGGSEPEDLPYQCVSIPFGGARRARVEYAVVTSEGARAVRAGASVPHEVALDVPHDLQLDAAGGRVRCSIDGKLVLDTALARDSVAGDVGFRASRCRLRIDDVEVRSLSHEEATPLRVRYGPLRRVPVIAHRGASRDAPENTLAAIRDATRAGADAVEFDVHRTRDGAIVCIHDDDLGRTTDAARVLEGRTDLAVRAVDLADVRRLDAGGWKAPRFQGERIPTLEEALRELRGRATAIVEIKPRDIGGDVASDLKRLEIETGVFVQSFSPHAVAEFHRELPTVPTGLLTGDRVTEDGRQRARVHLEEARAAGANAVVCHFSLVGPKYLEELHSHAMAVWVYTVDDSRLWETLIRLGVDGVITNTPGELRAFLESALPKGLPVGGGASSGSATASESVRGQQVRIRAGEARVLDLLAFLSDATGLPVVHDGMGTSLGELRVVIPSDIDAADAELVTKILEGAGFLLLERRLGDGRSVLEVFSPGGGARVPSPREMPVVVASPPRQTALVPSTPADATQERAGMGLVLEPVSEALSAQLELPPGQGLLVTRAAPRGTLGLEGLEPYDVITHVGRTAVGTAEELRKALSAGTAKSVGDLRVVRKGRVLVIRYGSDAATEE